MLLHDLHVKTATPHHCDWYDSPFCTRVQLDPKSLNSAYCRCPHSRRWYIGGMNWHIVMLIVREGPELHCLIFKACRNFHPLKHPFQAKRAQLVNAH